MMEWISVKDKVPEVGEDVIVFNETFKSIEIKRRLDEDYPDHSEHNNRIAWEGIFNEIHYWMPLPPKP